MARQNEGRETRFQAAEGGLPGSAWGAVNGAKQINLVTLLCSTLAFKSQETKDLVQIPTLHELGIQFSHQRDEGAKQALGPGLMYPQGPSGYTHYGDMLK